ncbi:ATP-binding cassette domain-containing protein [Candidatus Amarolinea dominans]|uniref:ABC transporter ATP-binding protein n=1 Tax=Candidatus Amarolinea dominans TaxID=3140696 RepID=UPI0031CCB0E5
MIPMIAVHDFAQDPPHGRCRSTCPAGVSFEIQQGEFIAIMGPSGSGKSTLMNLIGCLDTPSAGAYQLDGIDVEKLGSADLSLVRARKLGFVFQQYNLLARQSALRNVGDAVDLPGRGLLSAISATTALGIVGMSDRASPPQRVERRPTATRRHCARGGQPAVILADEPTGALDTKNQRRDHGHLAAPRSPARPDCGAGHA